MPTLIVCDRSGYDPEGEPYHGQLMLDCIASVGMASGWSVQAVGEGFFTAIEQGHKLFVTGNPPEDITHWIPKLIEHGAVCICAHQGFDLHRYPSVGRPLWPLVSVTAGTHGAGEQAISTLGWGPGLWGVVQTADGWNAPSWAASQLAAHLTRYPEAAADPQAAAIRWAAGLTPGSDRWSERTGFGTALIRERALVGAAVRVGDVPLNNILYSTNGEKESVVVAGQTDAWRYTCADVRHPFLAGYRSMPPATAGQGLRWTFYAHNHHAEQGVRLRARNGNVFVWLEPGASGTYTLDVPYHADALYIETTAPQYADNGNGTFGYFITGGAVDVTVASLRQDVYAMSDAPAPLAPAGGALSPLVSVVETAKPGKVLVSMTPLGGVGAAVRVDGVERLQTAGDSATLYLPAGVSTIEARALLAGGGVTEAHQPGTLALDVPLGYVPPAPALEVQRQGASLLVATEAEGATGYTITAQAGAETPVTVEGGEVEWPSHLPARVVATAAGAGGTSSVTTTRIPAVRSAAPLIEEGLHPRLTLA